MKNKFLKQGNCVIQSLIIIAIMGTLAIVSVLGIHKIVIAKANSTNDAILNSEKIDVDYLVNQG